MDTNPEVDSAVVEVAQDSKTEVVMVPIEVAVAITVAAAINKTIAVAVTSRLLNARTSRKVFHHFIT